MKTNWSLSFLYFVFLCTAIVSLCEAAEPSYEQVKTHIWKNTIHFIYEDNDMIEQYQKNYGSGFFTSMADFDSLKNEALEKSFFLSVEEEVNTEGIARKVMLERLVDTIAQRLGSHPNRKNDPVKLAKVDSLHRTLHGLIQEEYQPYQQTQYQQPVSSDEEIREPADTASLSLYNWIVIGLLILLIVLVGLAFWRIMKMMQYISEEMDTLHQYVQFNNSLPSDNSPSFSDSHQQQWASVQEELKSINEQISGLYGLMEHKASSSSETLPNENLLESSFDEGALQDKYIATKSKPTLFYAKKPNNYLFKHETLFTTARHDSIYRIQENGDRMATFTINEDKKVQDYALQNGGEMFLNEACEIQYENNRPVRIITEAPGKLVKEGKHWRIQEKAKVILK